MNQTEAVRRAVMICSVCNQEGQRIVCTSDNKSEIIFYHSKNILRTICRVVDGGAVNKTAVDDEELEEMRLHTI